MRPTNRELLGFLKMELKATRRRVTTYRKKLKDRVPTDYERGELAEIEQQVNRLERRIKPLER